MTDIASLGIKVTTDGVTQSAAELDKLDASGQRAAASTDKLNKSFSQSGGIQTNSKSIAQSYKLQRDELSKLIGEIDPAVSKLDALDKQQAKLNAFKKSGAISGEDFAVYSAKIDKARLSVDGISTATHKLSLNSSMARRELGRMGTDVAQGNYGRLSNTTLTLANYTGVMGLAFSAAGAAIFATVGAMAALAVAYSKGASESRELNKALILTGDYASDSAGSLGKMAKGIEGIGGSNLHSTTDALAQVASTGKFTADQIQLVTTAALQMKDATGQSIGDTIKQFEQLGDDPVKAILKLNSTMHFLTVAQLDNIRGLQEQGRQVEAVSAAFQAYADRVNNVTPALINNLSETGKIWRGIKIDISGVADALMDVGREGTTANNILAGLAPLWARVAANVLAAKGSMIEAANKPIQWIVGGVSPIGAPPGGGIVDNAKDQAQQDFQKAGLQYATKQARMEKDIADAKALGLKAGESQLAIDTRISAIRASYADKVKVPRAGRAASTVDPLASLNTLTDRAITQNSIGPSGDAQTRLIQEQVKQLQALAVAGAEAMKKGASLADVQERVATASAAVNEHFKAEADQLKQKNIDAVNAYKASLDDMLETRKAQIALQVQSVGMSQKEIAQNQELLSIEQNYNRQKAALLRQQQNTTSELQKAFFQEKLDALKKSNDDNVQATKEGWAAQTDAQANGIAGMQAAMKDFVDEQSNMARISYDFTRQFTSGFADAFASFASGTESAKKAFGSFIDSMYQQSLKFLANQAIASLFKSFGKGGGGWSSLLGNFLGGLGFGGGGYNSLSPSGQVAADVAGNYANGGPVSPGKLYQVNENGPELYTQGNRTYLMAGSQAGRVTPLTQGGGGTTVVQNIVVSGLVNRQTQDALAQRTAQRQRLATARNG